jgi:hypothetical protein
MATKKRGILTAPPQWWKHLCWCKRQFWKRERRNARAEAQAGTAWRTAAEVRNGW